MVKYCPNCGTPNDDQAKFCIKCGFNFIAQQNAQNQNFSNQENAFNQNQGFYGSYGGQQQYGQNVPPYGSQQGYQGQPFGQQYSSFQTAKTMAILSLIFPILILIYYIIEIITTTISIIAISPFAILAVLVAYLVIFLIFLVFDIMLFFKTYKIYNLVNSNRFNEALQEESLFWIIIGFIFGAIITGIFMLLTKSFIEKGLGLPSII
ncbi:MAG: zinc-ribbon domain-containing protein [Thermoplasmata archaeon]|nr:zinc ribbon domain-containing protein [Thermoplasmata archaeon]